MTLMYFLTIALFIFLSVLLCSVILLQEGKGGGLGASLGGGGGGESLFGTSTADVLKTFTAWLALIFFTSCIILSLWTSALGRTPAPDYPTIEQLD